MAKEILSSLQLNTSIANGTYIRQDLVEQREADLLKQLEVAEDTVDVLEQLLQKYGAEILRLRAYNDVLRQLNPPVPAPAPLPPNHPFVWPNQQQPTYPWNDMNKVWCGTPQMNQQVGIVTKEVPDLTNHESLVNDIMGVLRDIQAGCDPIAAIQSRSK